MVILPWSACHLTRLCLKNAPTASQLLQVLMCCLFGTSKNVILWAGKLTEWKIVMYGSLMEWFSYLGTHKTTTQKMWVHLIELKSHFSPFVFFCLFVCLFLLLLCCSVLLVYYSWMHHAMQHSSEIWMKKRIKKITENKFLSFSCFCLHESILLQTV